MGASLFNRLLFVVSATLSILVLFWPPLLTNVRAQATVTAPRNVTLTVGYLRMSTVDDPNILAAFASTFESSNTNKHVEGIQFKLHVVTVPCPSLKACASLSQVDIETYVHPFLTRMSDFVAVLRPNHLLAPLVIDRATQLGGVPIIGPHTIRAKDFKEGSEHIVNFEHYITAEIAHLFKFMQQSDGCAHTGIIYENFSEMTDHVATTVTVFTDGGLPPPATLDLSNATNSSILNFFTENPLRNCFLFLGTHLALDQIANSLYGAFVEVLLNTYGNSIRFADLPQTAKPHIYGISLMGGTSFKVTEGVTNATKLIVGDVDVFSHTYFTQWSPPYLGGRLFGAGVDLALSFEAFRSNLSPGEAASLFALGFESVPTRVNDATMAGYLLASFLIDSVRVAASVNFARINASAAVALPWDALVDSFYDYPHTVGGFPFDRLRRKCPPKPLDQICYCNSAAITSYIFRVNDSSPVGKPYAVYDSVEEGQRGVASQELDGACELNVTSQSYPITVIMFKVNATYYEELALSENNSLVSSAETRVVRQEMIDASFRQRVYALNNAPIAPVRPYRYVGEVVNKGYDTQLAIAKQGVRYNPFIIISSAEGNIEAAPVLTLLPFLLKQRVEDPKLALHATGEWEETLINLIPVLADYIHTFAKYYHDSLYVKAGTAVIAGFSQQGDGKNKQRRYSSLHIICSNEAEATLVSKSMATFGYDVPITAMTISTDDAVWSASLAQWLSPSTAATDPNPFILAVTASVASVTVTLFQSVINAPENRATVAIATSTQSLNLYYKLFPLLGSRDILFASSLWDWWMPEKHTGLTETEKALAADPLFWFTQAAADITFQISQRAQLDYTKSAAEIVYEIGVFASGGNSYGPLSNETCTDEQIASNTRDRYCQCTKGARMIFLVSMKSWQESVSSHNSTNKYAFHMAKCGVNYLPYIPPPVEPASLSSSAIAGIVVGAVSVLLLMGASFVVYTRFCTGRNNRAAPNDPSRPFTIVFTDIQSSTALWARAPSAMSDAVEEHHSIIRKIIRKHDGYEVKTIGDSFMIAFKDQHNAVEASLAIQMGLFQGSWNDEINAVYAELLAEMAAEAEEQFDTQQQQQQQNQTADETTQPSANPSFVGTNRQNNDAFASFSVQPPFASPSAALATATPPAQVTSTPPTGAATASPPAASPPSAGSPRPVAAMALSANRPSSQFVAIVKAPSDDGGGSDKEMAAIHTEHELADHDESLPLTTALSTNNMKKQLTSGDNTNSKLPSIIGRGSQQYSQIYSPAAGGGGGNDRSDVYSQPFAGRGSIGRDSLSSVVISVPYSTDRRIWNGIRVRIGVHYGMGDIRKDPVSLGYDYYGTVVNTAARVEGVGHGGQVLITEDTNKALDDGFLRSLDVVAISLGPQPLRGLDGPITLVQILPKRISPRRFPPLRLHIENVTEQESNTETTTTTSSGDVATPQDLAVQLCAQQQYAGHITPDTLLANLAVLTTVFGPTRPKFQQETYAKLGLAWGLEFANKAVKHDGTRQRMLITLMGRVSKSIQVNNQRAAKEKASSHGGGRRGKHHSDAFTSNMDSLMPPSTFASVVGGVGGGMVAQRSSAHLGVADEGTTGASSLPVRVAEMPQISPLGGSQVLLSNGGLGSFCGASHLIAAAGNSINGGINAVTAFNGSQMSMSEGGRPRAASPLSFKLGASTTAGGGGGGGEQHGGAAPMLSTGFANRPSSRRNAPPVVQIAVPDNSHHYHYGGSGGAGKGSDSLGKSQSSVNSP